MAEKRESLHGQWSSRWAFILAATGSAVGLGNIWKFPYITGENGGGAFVLVYLLCVAAIGVPIMMAEIMLGRRGRRSPMNTMLALSQDGNHSPLWKYLGGMGMIAGFLILSYYSVIAGWALAYVFRAASGMFVDANPEAIGAIFTDLTSDPEKLLAWHTIFMTMTMVIVARGVRSGLERAVRFLIPGLFALLIILIGYAMNTGAFMDGLAFLFRPDFGRISGTGILIAMGHAFFTLSLGMGAIMVYGSYLPANTSIAKTSFAVAGADTLVALMAGMVIFPIVFANGLEPGAGPGLIFNTLPVAFGQMPGGTFFGTLFFILLVFAAWSSSISLIEPMVTWMVENHKMRRVSAVAWSGVLTWVLGLGTVFSFNLIADDKLFGMNFFDMLDFLTANIMLPAGGLLVAIFAAWVMNRDATREELAIEKPFGYRLWYYLTRFLTPLAVIVVFLNAIGVIKA